MMRVLCSKDKMIHNQLFYIRQLMKFNFKKYKHSFNIFL